MDKDILDAEPYLGERAERGKGVDIDSILSLVPSVEPTPVDRVSPVVNAQPLESDL